jgi:fumarate reductase subunit D
MRIRASFPLLILLFALAAPLALAQSTNLSTTKEQSLSQKEGVAAQAALANAQSVTGALTMVQTAERIASAKRLLKAHTTVASSDFVTLAALDPATSQIHLLPVSKELFSTRGAETSLTTSLGHGARLKIVRANGVNTAVTVTDEATGRSLVPLAVEYPVRSGKLAYYTSAHPAILSQEVVADGKTYVRRMLEEVARRLRVEGINIAPEIVDVAEHLCIVEHADHGRFRAENRSALFEEILSLYALNAGDTYRYSVSVAGAGGMVQMIPSTYEMVRRLHPEVELNPDFVEGMSDHANALSAMLLYMQDTWDTLARSQDVQDALRSGIATQPELLAAGYNSNPARLPLYLRRGGPGWRTLIPTETQMYLQIYGSLDSLITFNRSRPEPQAPDALAPPALAALNRILQPRGKSKAAPVAGDWFIGASLALADLK